MVEPNKVIIPYTPRPLQQTFHQQARRFNVCVMHRRFGKTVMAINWLLREVLTCDRKNAQGGLYCAHLCGGKADCLGHVA